MVNQKIIVTTDDLVYSQLLQDLLADEGYSDVLCVAHAAAYQVARYQQPAVLLLDVHGAQPASDWELLDKLWGDPDTAYIPVIVCSTMRLSAWQSRQWARDMPCDYLEKPFQLDDLLGRIAALLRQPGANAVGQGG